MANTTGLHNRLQFKLRKDQNDVDMLVKWWGQTLYPWFRFRNPAENIWIKEIRHYITMKSFR